MNDVPMHSLGMPSSSMVKTNNDDDDSLPDITLYPFDAIVDTVKVNIIKQLSRYDCISKYTLYM